MQFLVNNVISRHSVTIVRLQVADIQYPLPLNSYYHKLLSKRTINIAMPVTCNP